MSATFFEACRAGEIDTLRSMLTADSSLARATDPTAPHGGWTGLHAAAKAGHAEAVRLLLDYGADPHAREEGDNTYALHWAAARGDLETVRVLLDAGSDVHGSGDLHEMDVIGWAALFGGTAVVPLLLERGARHHIFSAIALGDLDAIREVVRTDPKALERRMSRFERRLTPLHFAIERKRYDILDLLVDTGADLEAQDGGSQTALAVSMVRGDSEAMTRLHSAGAGLPDGPAPEEFRQQMEQLGASVTKIVPTLRVPDIARALDWYTSIGFKELARYDDGGVVWGMVSFGSVELALDGNGQAGPHSFSLWFETTDIDPLYRLLKGRQLAAARALLEGRSGEEPIYFEEELYEPFYGGRQFSIRDLNGFVLVFLQPAER